jgi:DNA-binding NarL/FixJ family response regulator
MSDALPHRMLLVVDHDLLAQSLAKVLGGGSEEVDRRRSDLGAGVLDAVRDGAHEVVLLDLDPWSERPDLQGLVGHLDAGVVQP